MRYLVAMIFAIACAGLATVFFSSPIATWVVGRLTFESPDDVGNLHAMVFMAVNLAALAFGWALGWRVGRDLGREEPEA